MPYTRLRFRIFSIALLTIMTSIITSSCKKESEEETGTMTLKFTFSVDNETLQKDTMAYTNTAGNLYEVTEVKFFISDLTLIDNNNNRTTLTDNNSIHYIDNNITSTLTWQPKDEVKAGEYKAIEFRFGIKDEKNKTYTFLNPPESNMAWPDILGGGYHYMMINGKWQKNDTIAPFNFHLGRGQEYDGETITNFIDNSFVINVPNSAFDMTGNGVTLTLDMNINKWFCEPEIFDFNIFGGAIMTNQTAQEVARKNGHNVFSIKRN